MQCSCFWRFTQIYIHEIKKSEFSSKVATLGKSIIYPVAHKTMIVAEKMLFMF